MKTIKEICKELKQELNIIDSDEEIIPENRIKLGDIMLEQEWKKSGITCLASRPTVGKTALAIDLILDAAQQTKKPIIVFMLEMNARQLVHRMIRNISGIREDIHTTDAPESASAISYLEKLNIFIDDTPGITIQEAEKRIRDFQEVGMVVIDYIQLMSSAGNNTFKNHKEEVRWIAKKLSQISEEKQLPILTLSQLPREIDMRKNKRPRLDDMHRDLHPEDVDQVIFLYRKEYLIKDNCKTNDSAEIILAKSKSYSPKTIQAWFDKVPLCFRKRFLFVFVKNKLLSL